MYLVNYIRPNIAFTMSLLARHSRSWPIFPKN
jgi:hypothetical protein